MKLLWCHSHFVWLVFEGSIPTCACFHSENFFVTLHNRSSIIKVKEVLGGMLDRYMYTDTLDREINMVMQSLFHLFYDFIISCRRNTLHAH